MDHGKKIGRGSFNPPDVSIGYGLNALNKYENGNNDRLTCRLR